MSKVIGIDLGTGFSAVSYYNGREAEIIVNSEGNRTTPSIIGLKKGDRKVGTAAKRQQIVNPKETVSIIKRFMGLKYDDPDCQKAIKHVNYEIVNDGNLPRVLIEDRKYSPEELSSYILSYLKKVAEDYLGETVKDAVITCPAYFTNEAREATKLAGELAGLNVLRIISEPTAALLASNLDLKSEKKIMVTDIGSGTTDFSIAEVSDGMIEIKASYGDAFLGGTDIDLLIADWIISEFKTETGVDLKKDAQALQRVMEAAEKAKIELSSTNTTDINLPYISMSDNSPLHLTKTLTKAKFEQLIQPLINKVIQCGKEALEASGFKKTDLDGILLVGGSCRIPMLQDELKKTFDVEIHKTANLDECVSLGATVQGSIIKGESTDLLLVDVTPLSLGIEVMGGVVSKLIEANSTIPTRKTQVFTTAADNQPSVEINVLQGERPLAKDNKTIGLFSLGNILPARRGVPKIEVSFDIDVNGILTVSAKDVGTGKEQKITIEAKSGLSQEDIDRIKREAEEFAVQDKKEKEEIDKLNKLDSLIFQTENQIQDFGDKLTDEDKANLTTVVDELKAAFSSKDTSNVDNLEKKLTDVWTPIISKIYANSGGESQTSNPFENMTDNPFGGGFNPQSNQAENVDFEEVK